MGRHCDLYTADTDTIECGGHVPIVCAWGCVYTQPQSVSHLLYFRSLDGSQAYDCPPLTVCVLIGRTLMGQRECTNQYDDNVFVHFNLTITSEWGMIGGYLKTPSHSDLPFG